VVGEGAPIDFSPPSAPSFETFAGFASASAFPPAIGSSISRCPSTLVFGRFGLDALAGLPLSFAVSAITDARLWRNASIRSGMARGGGNVFTVAGSPACFCCSISTTAYTAVHDEADSICSVTALI